MYYSGKLVIIGILAVAVASAAASWWFRYAATHRAAQFWGPETARLIRDAPTVELYQSKPPATFTPLSRIDDFLERADARDVSNAPGLTHLRNALLEDRSYRWPPRPMQPVQRWPWLLSFRNERQNEAAVLVFSPDWQYVGRLGRKEVVSCQPIADGLAEMLGELAPAGEANAIAPPAPAANSR